MVWLVCSILMFGALQAVSQELQLDSTCDKGFEAGPSSALCQQWKNLGRASSKKKQSHTQSDTDELDRSHPIFNQSTTATSSTEADILSIFNQGRAEILRMITRQKEGLLTDLDKDVIGFINEIKVELFDSSSPDCQGGGDVHSVINYYGFSHSVKICPSFVRFNKSVQFMSVAHGIGHAISPCHMEHIYWPTTKARKVLAKKGGVKFSEVDKATEAMLIHLLRGSRPMGLNHGGELSILKKLKKNGLVRSSSVDRVNHPFGHLYQCFEKYHGKAHGKAPPLQVAIQLCSSQVEELFADRFAAEFAAYLVAHHSEFGKKEARNLFHWSVMLNCFGRQQTARGRVTSDQTGALRDYPPGLTRLNTFLQFPAIQSSLGCSQIEKKPPCGIREFPLLTSIGKKLELEETSGAAPTGK